MNSHIGDHSNHCLWILSLTKFSYPSGRVAISITSLEQGLYTYVIQDDDADQRVLGVFKPDGFAMCNYAQGSVR